MVGTRRGLLEAVGSVAAAASLGWSYLPRSTGYGFGRVAGAAGPRGLSSPSLDELLSRARDGGLVLYVPPPAPTASRTETPAWGLERSYRACVAPLSADGRGRARRLGDAFRALDVPIDPVVSSRSCACLDTARLAFGRVTPSAAVTERPDISGGSEATGRRNSPVPGPLRTTPPDGTNRVVVGRRAPLADATGVSLDAGEIAVFAPETGAEPGAIGRLRTAAIRQRAAAVGTPTVSVTAYPIRSGTPQKTAVHRIRTGRSGPTMFVVGGVHGNEAAGYRTARRATDWRIDAGTLVVLPRANRPAIVRNERTGPNGEDLNRQFPLHEVPSTPLARAIWATVLRHDPDVLVDLHASAGLLARDRGYVGQAVFVSGYPELTRTVERTVAYLNRTVVPESRPDYDYLVGEMDGDPEGMLATKAAREANVPACIYEVTEKDLSPETQIEWTTAFLRRMLSGYGIVAEG